MAEQRTEKTPVPAAPIAEPSSSAAQLCEVYGCGMPHDPSIDGQGVYVCLHHRGWLETIDARRLRAVKGVK